MEDLRPEDFSLLREDFAKTNGLVGIKNLVSRTRMVFGYTFKAGLIEKPILFGPDFTRPSAKAICKQCAPRMFEADGIRRMLDGAKPTMRAMIYCKGRGFYALRQVFETIGGESRDQVAVDALMGHERGDMASIYCERISDDRLEHAVNVVRDWLFAEETEATEDGPAVVRFPSVG